MSYKLNKQTIIHTAVADVVFPAGTKVNFAPEGVYIGDYLFVPMAVHTGRRWYAVVDGELLPVHFPDGGEPYPFAAYKTN